LAAPVAVVELTALGRGFFPTLPDAELRRPGPLADRLASELAGARYFMDPVVEAWPPLDRDDPSPDYQAFKESVWLGFRDKLTGVSGAAAELRAAGGAFEPLAPASAQDVMEALRKARGDARARLMAWAGVRMWLARPGTKEDGLAAAGEALWSLHRNPLESPPARWLDQEEGRGLDVPFDEAPPPRGEGVALRHPRADVVEAELGGEEKDGILFLAEPWYPGWRAFVDGRRTPLRRVLGTFCAVDVPAGGRRVRLEYDPGSWRLGALLTLLSLAALAAAALARLDAQVL
ncbi:MAG: YfhO family protein, partial [Elusimicrobia bacterium]|nr:YfhO family protein [Elusimicrobiota bacterium]